MQKIKGLKLLAVLAVLAVVAFAGQAQAQLIEVDLELALLVDVSGSVDANEFALQRDGYVNAFKNATIQNAITSGQHGQIAATYVYWSGVSQQQQTVGWTLINNAASADGFANAIAAAGRPYSGLTAPGSAINFAVPLFNNAYDGTRLVIDVSGDGQRNDGADTKTASNNAAAAGITINGVTIGGGTSLFDWYVANVQTTDGFVIAAGDFSDFQGAVFDKLELEITGGDPKIPEPASMLLLGSGLLGFAGLKRKKAQSING